MKLAIGNLIDATESTARHILRVVGVNRDDHGRIAEIAVFNVTHPEMPDVVSAERASELLSRGDWVLRGADQEIEFDQQQRHIRSLDDIPPKRRPRFERVMKANFSSIQPLLALGWDLFAPLERSAKIASLCETRDGSPSISRSWITELLRRYWKSGNNAYALGPQNHRAGAKSRRASLNQGSRRRPGRTPRVVVSYPDGTRTDRGGCAIPAQALGVIEQTIADYFQDPCNQSLISIYRNRWHGLPWRDITKTVNRRLSGLPAFRHLKTSRRQVAYIGKPTIDMVKVLRRAKGHRHTNMNHRALNGDYRDVARFAGQRYEADTFLVDLHLVDDMTGLTVGRLRVYLIVDVFSGMVVGVYGTINEVDYAHVGRALHAAFAPKADYCKMFGLDIKPGDWDCEGLPELISADNKELITRAMSELPELVDTGIARPYRGDDKGSVEVASSLLQSGHIMLYGEGVTKGPKLRCAEDAAMRATARISTFMCELIRYVIYTHNHRELPRTRQIPAEFLKTKQLISPFNLWNWSRRKVGGALRPYNATKMMPRLLPGADAKVDRHGILHQGLYFELPQQMDHLRAASTCARVDKVRVHVDPLSTNQVYLVPRDLSAAPIRCPLTHYSREALSLAWAEKTLRDDYVEKLHRLTEADAVSRSDASFVQQRAALAKDRDRLNEVYGSARVREAVARQVSRDAVKDYQAATDDKRMTEFVHGALPIPDIVSPPTTQTATPTSAPTETNVPATTQSSGSDKASVEPDMLNS